ncbi:hypothetical protein Tco_1142987 [Tanacetum coccineum]
MDAHMILLRGHPLSDHSSPDFPLALACLGAISQETIPSPKRVRDSGYLVDVEVDPRETSLRDDVIVKGSGEPHLEQDIDPEIQAGVVVEAVDRERSETGARGPVEVRVERVTHLAMPNDIPEPAQEGAVEVIEGVQREQDRIIGVESVVTALTDRITEKMPNTRSGASMTHEEVEELVTRRVAEEMEAREAARTLEPLNENGDEQEGEDGGNGNGGNGGNGNEGNRNGGNGGNRNGNKNGNHGINYGGFMPVAKKCTFQYFLKCKPHNFLGTKGVTIEELTIAGYIVTIVGEKVNAAESLLVVSTEVNAN